MINSGGFDVNVLPQYTPTNPSLAAFNPAQITHGILDALQVGGNLQQIKAFKQHADEIAATEGIRTKLLQAQADQAAIQRDHALAVKQHAIDSAIATFKANETLTPKETAEKVANIDSRMPNIANKGLLEGALLDNQLAATRFAGTQQKTTQAVESLANAAALEAAPNASLAAVKNAQTALINANSAYETAVQNFKTGTTDEKELTKAKIASEAAKAKLDDAQAQYYAGRNQAVTEASRIRAEKVDTHTKAYNSLSQDYARSVAAFKNLISEPAVNLANPDDQRFTASKLVQAASVPDNPGFWKRLFGLGDTEPIPTFVTDKIKEINDARAELKAQEHVLKQVRAKISSSIVDAESPDAAITASAAPTAVVYWRNSATGKIEPKP